MPSANTLPQPTEMARMLREPQAILFPLFPCLPCLWYPQGERRADDARPCIMYRRENHNQITVLEFRPGENYLHHDVRHIDDPFFEQHPRARVAENGGMGNGGCWDYVEGYSYDFPIPGRRRQTAAVNQQPEVSPLTAGMCEEILRLAGEGRKPGEIATALSSRGVTAQVVAEYLSNAGKSAT